MTSHQTTLVMLPGLDGTGLVKIEPFSEPQARPLPPSLPPLPCAWDSHGQY